MATINRFRIELDDADAAECPEQPFTLNLYRDGEDGTQSRFSLEIGSELSLLGDDMPGMLRQLADAWEDGEIEGVKMPAAGACSECGDNLSSGEGDESTCGSCFAEASA